MDLFFYSGAALKPGEEVLTTQTGIRPYNGDQRFKGQHELGSVSLTTHRIIWKSWGVTVGADLKHMVLVDKEIAGGLSAVFQNKTPKIVVHVERPSEVKYHGPWRDSGSAYFKLGFTEGGIDEFFKLLEEALAEKRWERPLNVRKGGRFTAGIVGIERQLEKEARNTEKNISEAFQDLNSLMDMAKPMVELANTISNKIKETQGSISDDQTIIFRQQLLSLGIKDPVTKAEFGSGSSYFEKLAVEIVKALEEPVKECGGMMSLVEAFIRLNRARGVELVSPEDLIHACYALEKLNQPLSLREFDSKVIVLQHESFDDETCVALAVSLVEDNISLTPEEYARIAGVPFLLAKHSLTLSEERGKLCRDETLEGLRFYPNYILEEFPE